MDTSCSGIYAITNTVNGKQYIGSAVNIHNRWRGHRYALKDGTHHSRYLLAAWRKYGATAFHFDILEVVTDLTLLLAREQFYLDQRFAARGSHEYNMRPRAESNLGFTHTMASRQLMSARRKGLACTWRDKLVGKTRTPEVRKVLSDLAKSRRWPEEHKARISATLKGRPKSKPKSERQLEASRHNSAMMHSPESRRKALETRKSRPPTPKQLAYWELLSRETAKRNRLRKQKP